MSAAVLAAALVCVSACETGGGSLPDVAERAQVDAGADALPFMSECTTDEECSTGLCFDFTVKGAFCSHACSSDLECESPSPGCNGKGVCKAPDGDSGGTGGGNGGGGG